jgi:hypothetical protein|tara:strand:+ start:369 stop:503 length:135 start_codon:yes stop_codon:yes gene_type:complete
MSINLIKNDGDCYKAALQSRNDSLRKAMFPEYCNERDVDLKIQP